MNEHHTHIARRDFLRTCAVAGAGFASGFHLAKAAARSTVGKPLPGEIVVGLEMGTYKTCVAVAERFADGTVRLLGIGRALSRGVTQHGITDLEWATQSLREAVRDAEVQSGVTIHRVALAVAGTKVAPYDDGRPTWEDIFEWDEICYADRGDGVLRRVGLAECKRTPFLSVVWGAGTRIENSIRCLKNLGVEVERVVFAPVASAEAVLSAQQKQIGALVIDMGFGTTDYVVYAGGALVQGDSFPIGGEKMVGDLSRELRVPSWKAEKLKIQESTWRRYAIPREVIDRKQRERIQTIVNDRLEQAFTFVKCRLVNSGVQLDCLLAGVHLTGGCSLQAGVCDIAEQVFGIPASRARLKGISVAACAFDNPRLTCALGLAKLTPL